MADGENVVANQKNWEQRVNTELESSKTWAENWGSLYEGARTIDEQIADLEEKIRQLPGHRVQTNTQLSYTCSEPRFPDYPIGFANKRVLRMEDVEELAKTMMASANQEK